MPDIEVADLKFVIGGGLNCADRMEEDDNVLGLITREETTDECNTVCEMVYNSTYIHGTLVIVMKSRSASLEYTNSPIHSLLPKQEQMWAR